MEGIPLTIDFPIHSDRSAHRVTCICASVELLANESFAKWIILGKDSWQRLLRSKGGLRKSKMRSLRIIIAAPTAGYYC